MLVTEEEAQTRWCHASFVAGLNGNRYVDGKGNPLGAYCLGSGCMAWRWKHNMDTMGNLTDLSKPPGIARSVPPTHGWCGLAGRAE